MKVIKKNNVKKALKELKTRALACEPHMLYLEIIDNAGNVYSENGLYCNAANGPDELPPDVTFISLNTTDETTLDTVLRILSFGNYSKKELVLTVKVVDKSRSDSISGVEKVELIDGDNNEAEVLAKLDGNKDSDYEYTFKFSPDQIVEKWCVRVTDKNGYSRIASVSSLLNSDVSKPQVIEKPSEDDTADSSTTTTSYDWSKLSSDKWIFDSTSPKTNLFDYEGEQFVNGVHYYNLEGGKLVINATDDGGLETVLLTQTYKADSESEGQESQIDKVVYTNDKQIHSSYQYKVDTAKLKTGWYIFTIEATDFAGNPKSSNSTRIYVDKEAPEGEIKVVSPKTQKIGDKLWVKDKDDVGNTIPITFRLYADSKGAELYTLSLNINGKEFITDAKEFKDDNGRTYTDVTISADTLPYNNENVYQIRATIEAESRNKGFANYVLHVDTENPTIERFTVEKKNSAAETILNILTFGVFANDSIRFSVNVMDGEHDSGVADVKINYEGIDEPVSMTKAENGVYYYDMDISTQVFQSDISVTVFDNIGKTSLACPNIMNTEGNKSVANNFVMLENKLPEIIVELPPTDSVARNDGQIWYRQHFNSESDNEKIIKVTIHDVDSGIKEVEMLINGQSITPFSSEIEKDNLSLLTAEKTLQMGTESRTSLCSDFIYQYSTEAIANKITANQDGSYIIEFRVVDNAGNVATIPVNQLGTEFADGKVVYYRDAVSPKVTQFIFDPASYDDISEVNQDQFIEKLEYGYYFKREFDVLIMAEDPLPSSQLNTATFTLIPYMDKTAQEPEVYERPIVDGKATYSVRAGFKGQIFGKVNDKVNNVSEERTPQGFVSDEEAPKISIDPLPGTNWKDGKRQKLFTGSVQFRVTITDTQSGLRSIGYSKKSELNTHDEVVTSIDNFLGYNGESAIANGWQITQNDVNLVTEVSKVFTFDSDDNDIIMTFTAMDRSGNTSEPSSSEPFTIDTTAPKVYITSPPGLTNGSYYQGLEKGSDGETQRKSIEYTIKVTERNFSEELMKDEIVNTFTDAKPTVSFEPSGPNSYTATVLFPEGDYEFSFSGTDLGGHSAVIIVDGGEPSGYFFREFNVDSTAPKINTNFSCYKNSTGLHYDSSASIEDVFNNEYDDRIFFNKEDSKKAIDVISKIPEIIEKNKEQTDSTESSSATNSLTKKQFEAVSLTKKQFEAVKTHLFDKSKGLPIAVIEVEEHNFDPSDLNIVAKYAPAGFNPSSKQQLGNSIYPSSNWYHCGDEYILYILYPETVKETNEDGSEKNVDKEGTYVITMNPSDRADIQGVLQGNSINRTPLFEIDNTPPEYTKRTYSKSTNEPYSNKDKKVKVIEATEYASDENFVATPFYAVYDEKLKDASPPTVEFDDVNFKKIEVTAIIYTPVYKNGKELGEIKMSDESEKLSHPEHPFTDKQFTLSNFNDDGVYALTFVAVDKAGNRSEPISNTYFRMVDTDVLAYIYNSKKGDRNSDDEDQRPTGYYSLMNEDGKAISKKATDFDNLDILVIKPSDSEYSQAGTLVLREDEHNYFPSDYNAFKVDQEKVSDMTTMLKMHLPGEYFSETFRDDGLTTRMYLSVSIRDDVYLDLASIHIDNEAPTVTIPDDFKNWHNYFFESEHTITLTAISELLNDNKTKVYECPRNGERQEIEYTYDPQNNTLSFTLSKGVHHIDITLADEAGNEYNLDRVKYVRVGNFRLYLGGGIVIVLGVVAFFIIRRKRRT